MFIEQINDLLFLVLQTIIVINLVGLLTPLGVEPGKLGVGGKRQGPPDRWATKSPARNRNTLDVSRKLEDKPF